MIRVLACLICLAAPAWSGPWPSLYDVTGVAQDDVLNVRSAPFAASEIIGTLAPTARNVEVMALNEDATWGLVNVGEGSGWVSLAFLISGSTSELGDWPSVRHCFGTEPFWSAAIEGPVLLFSTPDVSGQAGLIAETVPAEGRVDRFVVRGSLLTNQTGPLDMSLVLRSRLCSDGMSDRTFGIDVDVILADGDDTDGMAQTTVLSGCCSLVSPSQ